MITCPATTEIPAETVRTSAEFGSTPLFTSLSEMMASGNMAKLEAPSHCLSEKLVPKRLLEIRVGTSAVMAIRGFVHEFSQQAADGLDHVQGSFHLVTSPENPPLIDVEE